LLVPNLVRRVVGREGVDLLLDAVPYTALPRSPGVITAESPEEQGLGIDVPNRPPIVAGIVEQRRARLRVTEVAPDVARLRLWAEPDPMPSDDGGGLGILIEHPGLASTEPSQLFEFDEHPFAFRFRNLLRSGGERRQVHGFPLAPALGFGDGHVSVSIELAPGADVLGFGEQHGRLIKNGQRLELRNEDALGTGTGRTYKSVPVFHVGDATVFIYTPAVVRADVGATDPTLLVIHVEEPALDMFVIGGGPLKHRLSRYTELTGRSPVPPTWAFGLWMSRCRYRNRHELMEAARCMRKHRIPCDVLHIDPDWLELDHLNCDFVWSERKYPDPAGMIRELSELGYHVSVWELPYIDSASPVYEEAARAGYLVRRGDGSIAAADTAGPDRRPRGVVDFSQPAARRWWQDKHASLFEMGVAVMKTDFGEGLPEDAMMADGRSGRGWRNLYPLWYNRTVWEITPHGLVWGRSGWAGSQRYPAQWGGDPETSLAGMVSTLWGGLSYGLSAPGFWSHDIGGFYGRPPTPELYVRWAQFGLLSPLARAHGLSPREPWNFGQRALAIFREFVELRYRLLPYLLRVARQSSELGLPVLRPLVLEFPDDPGCRGLDLQYMLGPDLLVCPVFSESAEPVHVDVYLPAGADWVDWWTGEVQSGGRWLGVTVPLERLPLYRRAEGEIELGPVVQHTGELGR
jgi:alpha-D-xyloside xylohydrolase